MPGQGVPYTNVTPFLVPSQIVLVSGFVTPPRTLIDTAFSLANAASYDVRVLDAGGNPVSGTSVVFSTPFSGPSAFLVGVGGGHEYSTTTDGTGLATLPGPITANSIGGQWTFNAYLGTNSNVALITTMLNMATAPEPTQVAAISGYGQSADVNTNFANPLVGVIYDQYTYAMQVPCRFTVVPGGSGATGLFGISNTFDTTTDAAGYATSSVVTAKVAGGGWSVSFAPLTNPANKTASFALTNNTYTPPSQATSITLVDGSDQVQVYNQLFTKALSVHVVDQYGASLPNATVRFTLPVGSASFNTGPAQTADVTTTANGNAVSPRVVAGTTAGAFNCVVTSGTAPALNIPLVTANPAVATGMVYVSGSGQDAATGAAFALPLKVKVINAVGTPIDGIAVTFTAPVGQPSCTMAGSNVQIKNSGDA